MRNQLRGGCGPYDGVQVVECRVDSAALSDSLESAVVERSPVDPGSDGFAIVWVARSDGGRDVEEFASRLLVSDDLCLGVDLCLDNRLPQALA